MVAVAVGWQVYDIHRDPFDLGLIGLVELVPLLLFALPAGLVAVATGCTLSLTSIARGPAVQAVPGVAGLLAGIGFLRRSPVVLGAISLDLFAVLFGGAVALLPVFARSILHTGPAGLGVLRSTPAIGALLAGVLLTRRPVGGRAGRTLLLVVGVFGARMVVFGLSRSFAL